MTAQIFPGADVHEGVGGHNVYLNQTNQFLLSSKADMSVLRSHYNAFLAIIDRWVLQIVSRETESNGSSGQPLLALFQSYKYRNYDDNCFWKFKYLDVVKIPDSGWEQLTLARNTILAKGNAIASLSVSQQEAFLCTVISAAPRGVMDVLNEKRLHYYFCPEIGLALERNDDPQAFLAWLVGRATERRGDRSQKLKTPLYDAFLFYLADRCVLLRPYLSRVFHMDSLGVEIFLLSAPSEKFWGQLQERFALRRRLSNHSCQEKLLDRRLRQLKMHFFVLLGCSTVRGHSDLNQLLFEKYLNDVRGGPSKGEHVTHVSIMFQTLRDLTPNKALVPVLKTRKKHSYPGRFPWVYQVYSPTTAFLFPEANFFNDYRPQQNVIEWAEFFARRVAILETKTLTSWVSAIALFLTWLVATKNPSGNLLQLRRADINDGFSVAASKCFRAFLMRKEIGQQYTNLIISRLGELFARGILEDNLAAANPVILKLDLLKVVTRRVKTPRHALGRDMLEFIRAFNSKDEFAFSKTRTAHFRAIRDPISGTMERVWFPAIAIVLDFMLRVPVRGFQARYLDSGEGDEFQVDPNDLTKRIPNPGMSAMRGRREGVLCAIPSLRGETILGLFINTNKATVDRDGGYEIPWCDEELKANIQMMQAWQQHYNPISAPVLCCERYREPENPEVLASIKSTFALFRDPNDIDRLPITRDILSRYWDDLLAAVEDDLAKNHNRIISLTDEAIVNKGYRKTEKRRQGRYDLHTLRVSGITALIEAGLPPDMVMSVAGHATVVMTLYYNKVSAAALNQKLAACMLRSADCVREVGELGSDFEEMESFIFNKEEEDRQTGLEMLRRFGGHGDGAVEVMSHGICPGGECSSGGAFVNDAIGHLAVPRPLACSLCRYRLTGPMFLPGLIANANRLMHELRKKGQEISALNEEVQSEGATRAATAVARSKVQSLYKETDTICEEWAAEVTYVRMAEKMMETYLRSAPADDNASRLPMLTSLEQGALEARLELKSEFVLLQSLAESAHDWRGFRPQHAMSDHREFLNEVLAANDLQPFLLGLSGQMRDEAAVLLGRAIVAAVPDERIDSLRRAPCGLQAFPVLLEVIRKIETQSTSDAPQLAMAG